MYYITLLIHLAYSSESRGKDSSGLSSFNQRNKSIDVIKGPIPITKLFKENKVKIQISKSLDNKNHSKYIFGHARLVTNGTQLDHSNNQPVVKDGIIGVHNGIITNIILYII